MERLMFVLSVIALLVFSSATMLYAVVLAAILNQSIVWGFLICLALAILVVGAAKKEHARKPMRASVYVGAMAMMSMSAALIFAILLCIVAWWYPDAPNEIINWQK